MSTHRLLAIDDKTDICNLLQDVGERCGYAVTTATSSQIFCEAYQKLNPTLTIIDLQLAEQDIDGIELLRFLANKACQCPIIVMSGFDEKVLSTAFRLGKSHGLHMATSLKKPFKVNQITQLLEQAKINLAKPTAEELAKAICQDQLILHYQPKVTLSTGKISAVEALVRWKPTKEMLIMPDKFIRLAEESDLIKALTTWTIKEAFLQYDKWRQSGKEIAIALNLSAKVLDDLRLPDDIIAMAADYHIQPQHITFEITETAVMNQPRIAMDILTRLRLKGFHLSIDDFGTGYSSLVELYRMPFNEIKIDKSFVIQLGEEEEAKVITRSIIELGHNLGLTTVAEGVETQQAWDLLAGLNCDIAQGYYINRPATAARLSEWLETQADSSQINQGQIDQGKPDATKKKHTKKK